MATYKDVRPNPGGDDEGRYQELRGLLIGKYSVEVLPDPQDNDEVIFRVWFNDHCPIGGHTKLPD